MTSHDSPPNADNAASHRDDVTPADRSRYNLTEYAVIAALVLVVLIGAITLMGERFSGVERPPSATLPAP